MGTVSVRVPEELEKELESYIEEKNLDKSTAVRKLLKEGIKEWRQKKALENLEKGEITFIKAAKIADMSVWDFTELVKKHDINWVSKEHTKKDLEELEP